MSKCPRYELYRPDFMAPNPRVSVDKGIWALQQSDLGHIGDEEDLVDALDPDIQSYRYYESDNVLGKLYRAIDEKDFLAELQKRARGVEAADHCSQTLIRRLWAYVQQQMVLVQWEHHRDWARGIQEG